ncbi:lysozyme C, tracheal isozyme-like [Cetorhinus maximus]
MKALIILSALLVAASAKTLTRCQVVKALKDSLLTEFHQYSVADWVCLAHHESQYNTLEIGRDTKNGKDWSTNYGIFQISSKWWCDDGKTPNSENGCGMKCSDFMNNDENLIADINCAAKIAKQQGMEAWSSWVENCKGQWLSYYTYFCF